MVSYLQSIVSMALSCISSEIKRDTGRKLPFSYPRAFDASVRGSHQNIAIPFGVEKVEWCDYPMVWWKQFSRFDRIPACDKQTDDGQTDRQMDRRMDTL